MPTPLPGLTYGTQVNVWVSVMDVQVPGGSQSVLNVQLRMYGSVVLAGSNERNEAITWETAKLMPVPTGDADARVRVGRRSVIRTG